ncbi:antitoxin Xre/MbcA/ParS-like domain-containing protein [Flavisphingomonas formosensis]|uniref:antitoxin Xre/MbcA/ParS-like domain-containing protein n=1 Tax=Flavisphingomonas formosensis TaxID=861534 RepID=UPI0012FAA734|nr:antitoxin Xre/MbcA/ParS toxin-binding domain-containing protein [Sphingomonas formosensis]
MATQLQSPDARAGVRKLVASQVSDALARHQPGLAKAVAANTAQIVATVAAAVIGLSPSQQKRLKSRSSDLADMVAAWARDEQTGDGIAIPAPAEVEPRKGTGFGELIDAEEGRRRLAGYAVDVPLEDWAGPLAGSSALMTKMGIARSTLHDWQRRREVVALLKGARKHVFPLAQFVDGRPAQGIRDILDIVDSPRRAWFWMVQASPLLGGKRPIDLLKQDRRLEVMEAARIVFDRR